MRTVLRWEVPVDDQAHAIGAGPVCHVACFPRDRDVVQVWTLEDLPVGIPERPMPMVEVRVFGTGQGIPDGCEHLGSAVTSDGMLVWHVLSVGDA